MLGIIIGIGSVIMIMTLGEIAKQFLLSQITQFGTNVVEIGITGELGPFQSQTDVYFTLDDIKALEQSSLLTEITGISSAYTLSSTLEYAGDSHAVSVWGDTEAAFSVNNLNPVAGRVYTAAEADRADRSIVLTERFAEEVFDTAIKAIGKTIRINGTSFNVLGVVNDLPFGGGPIGGNYVFIPLKTAYAYLAPSEDVNKITFILVEFAEGTEPAGFQDRLLFEIKRIKHLDNDQDDVFFVANRQQFLDIFDNVLLAIQLFVAAIAAISLIVGGIGIMNIMLVTVKERTKEIGLRKAVGAKNRSILIQFLIEAAVLTTVGGIIGIVGGLGLCYLAVMVVNAVQPDWQIQFVLVPLAIGLACGVSMLTGIGFGLYPAWKASRLHPIEALRYE